MSCDKFSIGIFLSLIFINIFQHFRSFLCLCQHLPLLFMIIFKWPYRKLLLWNFANCLGTCFLTIECNTFFSITQCYVLVYFSKTFVCLSVSLFRTQCFISSDCKHLWNNRKFPLMLEQKLLIIYINSIFWIFIILLFLIKLSFLHWNH